MTAISRFFSANRVAAILTWLTGLSAFIVGITGTLPHAWQNYATIAAGLLTKAAIAIKFMHGSQNYDTLNAQVHIASIDRGLVHVTDATGETDTSDNPHLQGDPPLHGPAGKEHNDRVSNPGA